MNEKENIELTKDEIGGVAGGGGTKKGKDSDMVRCPSCGAANDVPAKAGRSVNCFKCGAEIEL